MARSGLQRRVLRRPAMIAMAACTAVSIGACTSKTTEPPTSKIVLVTEADDGGAVQAVVGDTVTLSLPSNPSTGYSWKVKTQPDASVLKLAGTHYAKPPTDAVGAGGTDVWDFTAVAAGSTKVDLEYVGPGTDAAVGKAYSVMIEVGAQA